MLLLNKKFSEELSACLEKKYKRKIKNAEFATFYNLQFDRSITSETARKWILGLSVPNVRIINDLANWFCLNSRRTILKYNPMFRTKQKIREHLSLR